MSEATAGVPAATGGGLAGWAAYAWANRKIVVLTFEVFWIAVFLLDAVARGGGSGIVQFVYVNF